LFIFILTVISIQNVSALDLTLSSPQSVSLNEEFTVSVTASVNSTEVYDVKILILDQEKNILSEIFNDAWKNPFYYLKSIFPSQAEFKIRATKPAENTLICARLRQSGKTPFNEKCNEIKIIASSTNENISSESSEENKKQDEEKDEVKIESEIPAPKLPTYQNISEQKPIKEKIILTAKTKPVSHITKNQLTINWIVYALLAFFAVIIILLALRKL